MELYYFKFGGLVLFILNTFPTYLFGIHKILLFLWCYELHYSWNSNAVRVVFLITQPTVSNTKLLKVMRNFRMKHCFGVKVWVKMFDVFSCVFIVDILARLCSENQYSLCYYKASYNTRIILQPRPVTNAQLSPHLHIPLPTPHHTYIPLPTPINPTTPYQFL